MVLKQENLSLLKEIGFFISISHINNKNYKKVRNLKMIELLF